MEATFFERLDVLDTATPLPLVLFLFREPAISVDRRRRALRMLESWLVRRMILGLTAKNYNQQIPVIIGRVAEAPERADEILLEELRTGDRTDQPLAERRRGAGLPPRAQRVRVPATAADRDALRAVEESLYTSKVQAVMVPRDLSVEHVMPQRWGDNWPLPAGLADEERAEAEAARNAKLH